MKKIFAAFTVMMMFAIAGLTAQETHSPMYYWRYKESVTLNGRRFFGSKADGATWSYADSWFEQDGYALVQGRKLHYWLYDTYTYHDGDGWTIIDEIIPSWVEDMGYVIDFDHVKKYSPNKKLANSVKALMKQRDCDVSVALITNESPNYVVINNYDESDNTYWTYVYNLYK